MLYYSRLIGDDEEGTVAALKSLRTPSSSQRSWSIAAASWTLGIERIMSANDPEQTLAGQFAVKQNITS
jgi:hypothetical protein